MEWAISWKAFWFIAFTALILFLILRFFKWKRTLPRFFFSDLQMLREAARGWQQRLASWPRWMLYLALGCFTLALLDPRLFFLKKGAMPGSQMAEPDEGIAIYFILDRSASMAESVLTYTPAGSREKVPKIDLLKRVTTEFIKGDPSVGLSGRPNDLIGIVALARSAEVLAPLTLDHGAILDTIAHLKQVPPGPETGGTVIGYGIFKTANLIAATRRFAEEMRSNGKPAYTMKSAVMILVTDGFQDPNPLDKDKSLRTMDIPEAAAYAKKVGVHLYIINVEPDMVKDEYAAVRHQMEKAAESTGGKFYLMQGYQGLAQIYSEIDKLEKSSIPTLDQSFQNVPKDEQPLRYQTLYLYPYLIFCGLMLLFLSLLLNSTWLRRVP